MATRTRYRDRIVDALGATAHVLSWVLLVVECVVTLAVAVAGGVVAVRRTPWGWTVCALALTWLTGVLAGWWRPLTYRGIFS